MTTNEFNENHWKFILDNCQTNEQRSYITEVRELLKNSSLKESSITRRIVYKNSKGVDVACIRLELSENNRIRKSKNKEAELMPEIIIKTAAIIEYVVKSTEISRRYGFLIGKDGIPEDLGCTYRSKDYKPIKGKIILLSDITRRSFAGQIISQNNSENLTKLIRYAIQEYVLN